MYIQDVSYDVWDREGNFGVQKSYKTLKFIVKSVYGNEYGPPKQEFIISIVLLWR